MQNCHQTGQNEPMSWTVRIGIVKYYQKNRRSVVNFVKNENRHIEGALLLYTCNPPIHYIVFAIPHKRNTFSENPADPQPGFRRLKAFPK